MKNRLRRAVKIFPAFVIGMILYIAFHELGHLIVAVSAGATITEYSIIHAHTSWVGDEFVVLINANEEQLKTELELLEKTTKKWSGSNVCSGTVANQLNHIPRKNKEEVPNILENSTSHYCDS